MEGASKRLKRCDGLIHFYEDETRLSLDACGQPRAFDLGSCSSKRSQGCIPFTVPIRDGRINKVVLSLTIIRAGKSWKAKAHDEWK